MNIFVNDKDDDGMALGGIDLKNFGGPYVPLKLSYFNHWDEWRQDILYLLIWKIIYQLFKYCGQYLYQG